MSDLPIASAAVLTGATLASGDLIPCLDVSASAGSKGSRITVEELFTGRSALSLAGAVSAAAWTTAGIGLTESARVFTDTTSSGTVAAAHTHVLGGNTIAASNVTTFTNYYGVYLKAPIAGSNVTLTNKWALGCDSLKVGGAATIAGALTVAAGNNASWIVCNGSDRGGTLGGHPGGNGFAINGIYSSDSIVMGNSTATECYGKFTGVSGVNYSLMLWSGTAGTAQAFTVANTYTSGTSYERVSVGWATNVCVISTEKGSGGGTLLGMTLGGSTTHPVSVYGVTPVAQASAITAPSGGAVQDAESRAAIASMITALKNFGITA